MSDLDLILSSLKARWLNGALSVLLTAFGVMLAVLVLQFGHHVQSRLNADGRGIDVVMGAKGSPLQLILSSVYHIDIPPGNIPYAEAEKWMNHPQVKTAVPLALGDNWKGYRIVGTTPAYMDHYRAGLSHGRVWERPFEALAGSAVGLSVGAAFAGAHGLSEGGHAHENEKYEIVGVLKPTGTVLDRLILTSLDSVLEIHGLEKTGQGHENGHDHHHDHDHDEENHAHEHKAPPEITAVLLTVKTPLAGINLPRPINRETALQAASPALEMTRLTAMLGLGSKSFAALAGLLVAIAALGIFAGLAGGLENRMGDLAVLRALGYSRARLFRIVAAEGLIIAGAGAVLGVAMGLGGFYVLTQVLTPLGAGGARVGFSAGSIPLLLAVLGAVLVAGLAAALIPALRASGVDVARQLSRGV